MVEDNNYKTGFYLAVALGMLSIFVLLTIASNNATEYAENLKSEKTTCDGQIAGLQKNQSEHVVAGKAVTMLMQDFATQLNTTKSNLILDCRDTVFLEDRYGICVVREKSNNNSFLVTMRLNFTKVE